MTPQYSMVIEWSEADQAYLVTLPEFGREPRTHGSTYEEAAERGHEVLESLIEIYRQDGIPLPAPAVKASVV